MHQRLLGRAVRRLVVAASALTCIGSVLAWPGGLAAQPSRPSAASPTALPAVLASITTDTGDFAPGHRDFTDYTTPGLCDAAVMETAAVLRNQLQAYLSYDTLRNMPAQDTLPSQAVQVARTCSARFTLANTPQEELGELLSLALAAHNDSLVPRILARRLAAASSPVERALLQRAAVGASLGAYVEWGIQRAEPAHPGLAEALVAQWDTQPDLDLRFFGHEALLAYGVAADDAALVHREAALISTLAHQVAEQPNLSKGVRDTASRTLHTAYNALAHLAYLQSADSLRAVARQAQQDLRSFPSDAICVGWRPNCRTASVDTIATMFAWRWEEGPPEPPLQADFWFPPRGAPKSDTLFPTPGKITLLVRAQAACALDSDVLLYHEVCHDLAEHVARWAQRYGPQGVAIVILGSEWGHAFLSGAETAAQEAERLRWYFQDFQQLPVAVAVREPTWKTFPLPDGRRFREQPDVRYGDPQGGVYDPSIVVVGRDGRRMFSDGINSGWGADNYLSIEEQIERVLRLQPSPTASNTSHPASPSVSP